MDFSDSERPFLDHLVGALGFRKDAFLPRYLGSLAAHGREFKEYFDKSRTGHGGKLGVDDLLRFELDLKTHSKYSRRRARGNVIAATDIASYTYCPVAFAIQSTYFVPKLWSSDVGVSLHERHGLLRRVARQQPDGQVLGPEADLGFIARRVNADATSDELFAELSESIAVFAGSAGDDTGTTVFVGKNPRFVGRPDYIFYNRRTERYFVVEEKFHCKHTTSQWETEPEGKGIRFHDSHLNQLRSYLFGIREHSLAHGYLICWGYSAIYGQDGRRFDNVEDAKARKILAGDEHDRRIVRGVYRNLRDCIDTGGGGFDPARRSPEKCGGCAVGILCGHKTGQYERFTVPYAEQFLQTRPVSFRDDVSRRTPFW